MQLKSDADYLAHKMATLCFMYKSKTQEILEKVFFMLISL